MRVFLLIVGMAAVAVAQDAVQIWNDERPGFLKRGIVLGQSFDEEHISAFCQRTLDERSDLQFIQLTFAPQYLRQRPKIDHMTYADWKNWHDASAKSQGAVAELVAVKGDAVLRIRDARGRVTQKVLRGHDPLVFEVGGLTFHILYFAFSELSPALIQVNSAEVYVESDRMPSAELGADIREHWRQLFPQFTTSLLFRQDLWFVYNPGFPFFYPFGEEGEPPSEQVYGRTHIMYCMDSSPVCRVF
jgi:hypothetical protein